jgi:glycosyltransferase involved in cell wall biosynthesis
MSPGAASPLTVLFAPAHTLIDEAEGGSEYYWPYKLIERLALDHGVRIIALTIQPRVTHPLPGVEFVSVSPGGGLPTSNLGRLLFHLRCYVTARHLLAGQRRIDVIHHMLPFGYRATFNLLALGRHCADPPIVIGPLQPPHSRDGGDERRIFARDFSACPSPGAPRRQPGPSVFSLVTLPVLAALQGGTLRRCAALVAVSARAARLYRPFAVGENLTVIPPGVDTEVFTPREASSDAAPTDQTRPVVILAVGYFVQRKAFDVLITAIAHLARRGATVNLRLVGDGPQRAALEDLVDRLGIGGVVTFTGRVPHAAIVHEYHRADLFCSPSFSEGFATVCLEALACGLPIVATPAGGFRDVLCRHDVGTLVGFGAVEELAAALGRLVADRSLRESLGRRARAVAVDEYDWRIVARRYLALYQHVLAYPERRG